jgi:protein SCO1/2
MERRRTVVIALGALGVFALVCGILFVALGGLDRPPANAEAFAGRTDGPLPTLWSAPSFELTDQKGNKVTAESLRGRPWIADFFYSQCTTACPMLTAKLVQVQRRMAALDVKFVSFSVDPAHDTPAALAIYAMRWAPNEPRWHLLSTSTESLDHVSEGFKVAATATADEANPILHSTLFFLVDADGELRGLYDSNDSEAVDRLVDDTKTLAKGRAQGTDGAALYDALGCAGCHEDHRVAPAIGALGTRRELEGDASIVVDDAYLRSSILEPERHRVAGYPVRMPSYAGQLTDAQLDALVAELHTRAQPAGDAGAAEPVRIAIDPVCGMKVRVEPDALHANVRGHEIYFCSEVCRDEMVRAPDRFLGDASP